MNMFLSILLSLGGVVGVLGMVLLIAGAVVCASADGGNAGPLA